MEKLKNVVESLLSSALHFKDILDSPIDKNLKLMLKGETFSEQLNSYLDRLPTEELIANMEFCRVMVVLMHGAIERRKVIN